MADFSIASQIQPFQAPNVLGVAEHVQKMQTSNMLMQQRAAELQKENALRAAAAQYGVNSKAYAEAAGRIDPEAGLKAFTYQRQQAAAGAAAAAAARAAELDRIRADTATVDLVSKHGDGFEKALRVVESYPEDQRAGVYGKLYEALPPKLKNFYNPTYSPEAVNRAMMTTAEIVSSLKPKEPKLMVDPMLGVMAVDPYGASQRRVPMVMPGTAAALGANNLAPPVAGAGAPNAMLQPPPAQRVPMMLGQQGNVPSLSVFPEPQSRGEAERQADIRKVEVAGATEAAKLESKSKFEASEKIPKYDDLIGQLSDAIKPGGLLSRATGSDIGAGVDRTLRVFGVSTPGSRATAALEPLAGALTAMVPRFEGPQSDADRESYERQAGLLADKSKPVDDRVAAAKAVLDIMKRNRNANVVKVGGEAAPAAKESKYAEGQTATGPNGAKLVFRNGQWTSP
tara:strand:- start:27 stop:1391 length:1365 start_codon:yes stop_codon:yes gene_type:complete